MPLRQHGQVVEYESLLGEIVVHDLDIDIIGPEYLHEPIHRLAFPAEISMQNGLARLSLEAAGEHDQAAPVLRELLRRHVLVLALYVVDVHETHEISVALVALRDRGQVVAPLRAEK